MGDLSQAFVRFNISGQRFQVLRRQRNPDADGNADDSKALSLLGHPDVATLLHQFITAGHENRLQIAEWYNSDTSEYCFNRDPEVFRCLLGYLEEEDQLHLPTDVCPEKIQHELRYWHIDENAVAPCCKGRLPKRKSIQKDANSRAAVRKRGSVSAPGTSVDAELNGPTDTGLPWLPHQLLTGAIRAGLWEAFEDSAGSILGIFIAALSITFVLVSVLGLVVASMPETQVEKYNVFTNETRMETNDVLKQVEMGCIVGFTVEYLVRLSLAPDRCKFVVEPLNVVDLFAIIPFYLELSLESSGFMENLKGVMVTLRILRVLRVARIFKLARYSGGLSSLGSTLSHSLREIGMLLTFMSITIILYSTTVYYLEKDVPGTRFTSIPDTCWWCIVTMTTVGYGDMVPQTVGGRLVATLTSISGVLVLALPITMIVENFNRSYTQQQTQAGRKSAAGVRRQPTLRRRYIVGAGRMVGIRMRNPSVT